MLDKFFLTIFKSKFTTPILITVLVISCIGLIYVNIHKEVTIEQQYMVDTKKIEKEADTKVLPYVKNGVLYTTIGNIPLKCVTNIEIIKKGIRYVVISYRLDGSRGGMMTMGYADFLKIEKYFRK